MENGYGRPSVTPKIWKQILKLKQIQCIFTHWMLLCNQLPPFVQSHSLFVRPLPKRQWMVASGETQFLNSNSKTGVQDPQGGHAWHARPLGMHAPQHTNTPGMHASQLAHFPGHGCPLGMHVPPPADTTRCGQWAGGTHPTGMHSCLVVR